jgi:hypothetical protein
MSLSPRSTMWAEKRIPCLTGLGTCPKFSVLQPSNFLVPTSISCPYTKSFRIRFGLRPTLSVGRMLHYLQYASRIGGTAPADEGVTGHAMHTHQLRRPKMRGLPAYQYFQSVSICICNTPSSERSHTHERRGLTSALIRFRLSHVL